MVFRKKKSRARFFRKAKRFGKRAGIGSSNKLVQIDAMIYGGLRQTASNMVAPLTAKIPAGQYADNIVMGLLCWFAAKKTGGMISQVARKGLVIENALVGEEVVKGGLFGMGGTTSASGSTFLYG